MQKQCEYNLQDNHLVLIHDSNNYSLIPTSSYLVKSCYREKELEMLMAMKDGNLEETENTDSNETIIGRFQKFLENNMMTLDTQEKISLEAANGLISKLNIDLQPFKIITDDKTPWEEKSAAVKLANKLHKHKRNKLWRKRKRQQIGEMLAKVSDTSTLNFNFIFFYIFF